MKEEVRNKHEIDEKLPAASKERLQSYEKLLSLAKEHKIALDETLANHMHLPEGQLWFLHVFAPTTVEFVSWVLDSARKDGIKRLYFLARDGYLLYATAKRICDIKQLDIECRYLKLSRYSLRVAEYALMGAELVEFICARGIDVTFEKMMHRGGLTDEEARHMAVLCGYENRYCEVLTYTQIDQIKDILRKSTEFHSYVNAHSKEAYPNVMGYLRQEGLLDGISYAVVDSGWLGTIQKSLKRLLKTEDPGANVQGYYFGLYETPTDAAASDYKAYYFEQKGGLRRKAHFSNCLFELVYSAPEGMTLGYEKIGGYYYPVESESVNPNGETICRNRELLENYVEAYVEACKQYDGVSSDNRVARKNNNGAMVEKLLTLLMSAPTKREVELFGMGLFCDDILESQMQTIAAELTYREIQDLRFVRKLLIMLGIRKGVIKDSAWIEGSIVRGGTRVKKSLRCAIRYKYFSYLRKAIKK